MKGQDSNLLFGLLIFLAVLIFFGSQIAASDPNFILLSAFDMTAIAAAFIGTAAACVIPAWITCAAALGIVSVGGFFVISNQAFFAIFVLPTIVVLAYLISGLAKGGK